MSWWSLLTSTDSKSSITGGYSLMPTFADVLFAVPGSGLLGEQPLQDKKEKKELLAASLSYN